MSDESDAPSLAHLYAERTRRGDGGIDYGAWRELVTPETVNLTYGFPFPDSFPNAELLDAAETLFEEEPERALQYGGGDYADELAGIVAERSQDRGIDCHEGEVMLTNGATNGIDVVCRTFLDPGDAVFVEAPSFTWSLAVIRSHGVETVGIEVDDDGVDVEALEAELARRRREDLAMPKLFYTIPNFQNPTGVTLSLERRERLLDLASEYDFVVLEDDAYGELRFEGEDVPPLRSLDDTGRVIHLGTFSKTIAPGIRTGWAIAEAGVVEQLGALHTGGPNRFTMGLLAAYCRAGYLDAAVPELREAYRDRRDHLLSCLEQSMPAGVEWTEPAGGFFVWVELPAGLDAEAMLEGAIERGVVYLPGRLFYTTETGGQHCLRLSFSRASFEEIERGIAALGETVAARLAD
jgi:2-aminoadipate transaminase